MELAGVTGSDLDIGHLWFVLASLRPLHITKSRFRQLHIKSTTSGSLRCHMSRSDPITLNKDCPEVNKILFGSHLDSRCRFTYSIEHE